MATSVRGAIRPAIFEDFAGVDSFEQPKCIAVVKGSQLKAGVVVLDDDLGTPSVGLDHRVRATPKSGAIAFLVSDFDRGGWRYVDFQPRSTVTVVGRQSRNVSSRNAEHD